MENKIYKLLFEAAKEGYLQEINGYVSLTQKGRRLIEVQEVDVVPTPTTSGKLAGKVLPWRFNETQRDLQGPWTPGTPLPNDPGGWQDEYERWKAMMAANPLFFNNGAWTPLGLQMLQMLYNFFATAIRNQTSGPNCRDCLPWTFQQWMAGQDQAWIARGTATENRTLMLKMLWAALQNPTPGGTSAGLWALIMEMSTWKALSWNDFQEMWGTASFQNMMHLMFQNMVPPLTGAALLDFYNSINRRFWPTWIQPPGPNDSSQTWPPYGGGPPPPPPPPGP